MAKLVCSRSRRTSSTGTSTLTSLCGSVISGYSSTGSVASANRLFPERTVTWSATSTEMRAPSGRERQISTSFRPGIVARPPRSISTPSRTRTLNSTSRSVAVMVRLSSRATTRRLDRTGSVCLRSTTPVTIDSARRSVSLSVLNFMSLRSPAILQFPLAPKALPSRQLVNSRCRLRQSSASSTLLSRVSRILR